MKILVVGLGPSKLYGKSPSLKRLNSWMEILGVSRFSFTNIYEDFDLKVKNIQNIRFLHEYDRVISLGLRAHSELCLLGVEHYALPHPSSLNRINNDSKHIKSWLEGCKKYLEESL